MPDQRRQNRKDKKMHIADNIGAGGRTASLSRFNLLRSLAQRHRERRAIARLKELNDHLLNDLGLTRGEIEDSVRNGRV
jgi:uncharacterized protein YjiS (DUF1127 family)